MESEALIDVMNGMTCMLEIAREMRFIGQVNLAMGIFMFIMFAFFLDRVNRP